MIALYKFIEVAFFQRIGLAEGRHFGTEIVYPYFLSIALIGSTSREEKYIGLYTLCIKDTSRKSENRMEIAFIHQVNTDILALSVSK